MGIEQMYLWNKQNIILKTEILVQAQFTDLLLNDEVYCIPALCYNIYSRECKCMDKSDNSCLQSNLIGLTQSLSVGLICENKWTPGETIILLALLRWHFHKYKKGWEEGRREHILTREKCLSVPRDHEQVTFTKHMWGWHCAVLCFANGVLSLCINSQRISDQLDRVFTNTWMIRTQSVLKWVAIMLSTERVQTRKRPV